MVDRTESVQQKNENLVWDLNRLKNRNRAKQFVMQFEKTLCVFSGPVRQLYTNYNIYLPQDAEHKLVILPNPAAHYDTFDGLPEDCAIDTGINIIPGEMVGKTGLYIQIPFRGGREVRTVPLGVGLNALIRSQKPDQPFLPVLTKGDLREMKEEFPCLHLHSLQINQVTERSEMEKKSIMKAIVGRLQPYLNPTKKAPAKKAAAKAPKRKAPPTLK